LHVATHHAPILLARKSQAGLVLVHKYFCEICAGFGRPFKD
jgi:hypothetical protein